MTYLEWSAVLLIGGLGVVRMIRANGRASERLPELVAELEADSNLSAAEKQDLSTGLRSASRYHLIDGALFVALAVIVGLLFASAA